MGGFVGIKANKVIQKGQTLFRELSIHLVVIIKSSDAREFIIHQILCIFSYVNLVYLNMMVLGQ